MFEIHDPGIGALLQPHAQPSSDVPPSQLMDRFVLPDLEESLRSEETDEPDQGSADRPGPFQPRGVFAAGNTLGSPEWEHRDDPGRPYPRDQTAPRGKREPLYRRVSAPDWLVQRDQSVILGKPGSGKSTLSRVVTLDLLADEPTLPRLAAKWGSHLPLWFPFAHWSQQITKEGSAPVSISDGIKNWLHAWDKSNLWPLVKKAMEDDRLLLVVDGLDEWSDESAAQRAMDRLRVFVVGQGISVLAFSRPHGFLRLKISTGGWSVAQMAGFSLAQQGQLADYWFQFRNKALRVRPGEIAERSSQETETFMAQLAENPDLSELAAVPLLLSLLVLFHQHNFQLPQNRFRAYAQLVEYLVSVHPEARWRAAQIKAASTDLSDDNLLKAFNWLAFEIHSRHPSGSIKREGARLAIREFLQDEDGGMGYELPAAEL